MISFFETGRAYKYGTGQGIRRCSTGSLSATGRRAGNRRLPSLTGAGPATTPIATNRKPGNEIRIALALGGGAARGWAHIGVLRALDKAGIEVGMIAGTSIGALVGGCYLAGKLDELEEFARSLTKRRMFGLLDCTSAATACSAA